jgi:cytochrome c biogenesis protein CcmG/thiol:disulfide interchange protein DsbE
MKSVLLRTCVVLSALLSLSCGSASDEAGSVEIGQRAPGFALKSLDGSTVASHSLTGHIVVLNFWATWCAPCVKELPDLQQVAANPGVKVVGIALDEDGAKTVKPFVEQHGLQQAANYTVLLGDQQLFDRFNGMGIPYTLLLDREQRVVKVYRGPTTKEVLEEDMKEITQGA